MEAQGQRVRMSTHRTERSHHGEWGPEPGRHQCVCALRMGEAKVLRSWQFAAVNDGVYERPRTSKLKRGTKGALPETTDDPWSLINTL